MNLELVTLLERVNLQISKLINMMKISSKLLFISINKFPTAGKYYTGKAQLALKNWKNLFGDQREDSLTSLEVCNLLKLNIC